MKEKQEERLDRKEWLERDINYLEDARLFADLSESEGQQLIDYSKEYALLLSDEEMEENKEKKVKSLEMKNRRRRGQYGEKQVAKEVGGRKDGRPGRRDVTQGMFSYEVKTTKKIPASILKLMSQAERLKKKDTIAVGVFRCNSPRDEYFIISKRDWLNLHGK